MGGGASNAGGVGRNRDSESISDKSIYYVTNNKRLYSTFCTVEANY